MSFAVWQGKPPFPEESLNPGELIYAREAGVWKHCADVKDETQVDLWVVTTDGLPTQPQVDAVLNPAPVKQPISDGELASLLVSKGIITESDITAATIAAPAPG